MEKIRHQVGDIRYRDAAELAVIVGIASDAVLVAAGGIPEPMA